MADRTRLLPGPPPNGPVTFTVDGRALVLPALDTRTWLDRLVLEPPGCWWHLLPGELEEEDAAWLLGRVVDTETDPDRPDTWRDGFDLDDLEDIAVTVLSQVLGVELWSASRLAGMAWANWFAFDGWSYRRGVDPLSVPINRLLAAVYIWRLEGCTKDVEVAQVDAELFAPGPPLRASGSRRNPRPIGWSDQMESAAFLAGFGARDANSPRGV